MIGISLKVGYLLELINTCIFLTNIYKNSSLWFYKLTKKERVCVRTYECLPLIPTKAMRSGKSFELGYIFGKMYCLLQKKTKYFGILWLRQQVLKDWVFQ